MRILFGILVLLLVTYLYLCIYLGPDSIIVLEKAQTNTETLFFITRTSDFWAEVECS